eukprot:9319023-Alexandrium_andersonii.AAC.1
MSASLVGSEMCIRDSLRLALRRAVGGGDEWVSPVGRRRASPSAQRAQSIPATSRRWRGAART